MSEKGQQVFTRSERTRQIALVLWITLALNWGVSALKIFFGLATRCMAITADGVHSLSDGTSNIVGLIAIYISGRPADKGHPYGHQKYETLASGAIAILLFIVAAGIFRKAIDGFIKNTTPEVNFFSFAVMGSTLLVNLFVVWYERKKGHLLQSDFLISDSWHTLTDVFVTVGVFIALIGIGLKVPRLDAIVSFFVAIVIVIAAIRIVKSSSDVLCDKAVLETGKIERIVRGIEGVKDCHEIRTRGRMDSVYVDLHVLVDNDMTTFASHHLANLIERNIRKEIPDVCDVVVHIEPLEHRHEEV